MTYLLIDFYSLAVHLYVSLSLLGLIICILGGRGSFYYPLWAGDLVLLLFRDRISFGT